MIRKGLAAVAAALATAALFSGCQTSAAPSDGSGGATTASAGFGGGITGPTTGTTVVTPGNTSAVQNFSSAGMVKVIFNKKSFYTNDSPNPQGCAGDARYYYDPKSDRAVPVAPSWLVNVGLDITNSNAIHGASRAQGCGIGGIGSPTAANCASFDDLQPLDGSASRTVLIGGYGCKLGIVNCPPVAITSDIWSLNTSDISTASTWTQQTAGLPYIPPVNNTPVPPLGGVTWHGGDYDTLHNQYYTFGGVVPPAQDETAPGIFTNSISQLNFEIDGSVSTVFPPAAIQTFILNLPPTAQVYSGRHLYAGWISTKFDAGLATYFPPQPMTGASFTYGLRRDPATKSLCKEGDMPGSLGISSCASVMSPLNDASGKPLTRALSLNEHDDYFLLSGGMPATGVFSPQIYFYKPHGYSNDVGTSTSNPPVTPPLPTAGEWMLMSNAAAAGASNSVMSVVDISTAPTRPSGASSNYVQIPYAPTMAGQKRSNGEVFQGWLGRAYHGTVYDPGMNRFYIYGGLENHGLYAGAPLPATTVPPDVATNDVWVYDPPSLGRRPTSACWTNKMPDGTVLNSATARQTAAAPVMNVLGANTTLDTNANYLKSPFVFPPGGCLQRIRSDVIQSLNGSPAIPPQRFAHGQVFDPDEKVMYVFGGCNAPSVIHSSGAPNAGDPVYKCAASGLLNDLWVYVPPEVSEIIPQTTSNTSFAPASGPYNALTLLGNVFGTDFWLDHLPFFQGNSATAPPLTAPDPYRVVGNWIRLQPGGSPSIPYPRAGAQVSFDRAHHRIYVQGGFGCVDSACVSSPPAALNDLWVYTPPTWDRDCPSFRTTGTCGAGQGFGQGSWMQIRPNQQASALSQPTQRYGGTMAFTAPQFSYGDDFYQVTDSACQFQGPIASPDTTVNKEFVGAIYINVNRNQFNSNENLLVNVRLLPFDTSTRLPAYNNAGTLTIASDDTDKAATSDVAVLRVQLMHDALTTSDAIQNSLQPRFHEYLTGSPILADTYVYVSGATGQVTEKQIFVPLSLDPTINLVKIERVTGSVKFFEMMVSKF